MISLSLSDSLVQLNGAAEDCGPLDFWVIWWSYFFSSGMLDFNKGFWEIPISLCLFMEL